MGDKVVHVCPEDQLDHNKVGHCWCHPAYDIRHDKTVVYHNRSDELHDYAVGYHQKDSPDVQAYLLAQVEAS
jgi:hypothetical protein